MSDKKKVEYACFSHGKVECDECLTMATLWMVHGMDQPRIPTEVDHLRHRLELAGRVVEAARCNKTQHLRCGHKGLQEALDAFDKAGGPPNG